MNLLDLSSIFLAGYALLAFLDGMVLHLWKYKLFSFPETIYEHVLHSIRAVLFPIIVTGLYVFDTRGLIFYPFLGLAVLDLVIQGFDMWEEKEARTRFGGLSSLEYILHVVLTSLHSSALLIYILSKPSEAWTFGNWEILNTRELPHFIGLNLIPGAILVAALHLILMMPRFVKK